MDTLKIALACDHAGFKTKEIIIKYLISEGYEIKDFGCFSEESVDYPDFAHPMAASVAEKRYDFGIALCGSGNGINMTANKHQAIRSALCWNTEISELARLHNNANICSVPARFVSEDLALEIVKIFLKTEFEGGRHQNRIDKIPVR
ncbi:MAG: ribose 5-phosphate isomerase B [Bacteroidales bacterium]|jgi:ribose 5-phosphate isomerase B|nr:ribose 5-phosphate isomerase B [Bacteroidales bacterium]